MAAGLVVQFAMLIHCMVREQPAALSSMMIFLHALGTHRFETWEDKRKHLLVVRLAYCGLASSVLGAGPKHACQSPGALEVGRGLLTAAAPA